MEFKDILMIRPYSLDKEKKSKILTERLKLLTKIHYKKCQEYRRIQEVFKTDCEKIDIQQDCPFLPVRIFKDMELKSITDKEVFKIMTSSGTTGQTVSKIFLDKDTALNQQKTLIKILSDFFGNERLPMLIIDSPSVVKNRSFFSARGAGILGFSIMASEKKYALDDEMNIDFQGIFKFLKKYKNERILLFGFTFIVWKYFYEKLKNNTEKIDLSNCILIHGGGWKKLKDEAVDPKTFKLELERVFGIKEIHDYYGMIEQTGCIYMECECGHLHTSIFSDVLTRRKEDFSICNFGEEGIIQVLSTIPESYPGHSILTEDMGIILGEDDCPCGRLGKYFKITGRMRNAEVRGCSDTYENK